MKHPAPSNFKIRKSEERGQADYGWLKAKHSFSFGDYNDPEHMSYRTLRVINEDLIAAGKGFGTHPHSSMEIFTYVISGELAHKDSMGNGRVIQAGEFQYMSAGSGVTHSEANPSSTDCTHLLQIWITPSELGGQPKYADMDTRKLKKQNALTLFASDNGRDGSIQMRQNAEIHFGSLLSGESFVIEKNKNLPYSWLQLIKGKLKILDKTLLAGDGISMDHISISIQAEENTEFLLFQLA